jgi:hypothetical protein
LICHLLSVLSTRGGAAMPMEMTRYLTGLATGDRIVATIGFSGTGGLRSCKPCWVGDHACWSAASIFENTRRWSRLRYGE